MSRFFLNAFAIIFITTLLGCAGANYLPSVNETDVNKYENIYLTEYEHLKKEQGLGQVVKWIQATNKKEECKLYVGTSTEDDRTIKPDYKIFWDGECRNGYAYGLGREFEKGILLDMEFIAIYSGQKEEPEYYYQKFNLNDIILEGDLTKGYFVKTTIQNNAMSFNLNYEYGYFPVNEPQLVNVSSPLSDNTIHFKAYPNFLYQIVDFRNNEFDARTFKYSIVNNKTKKENGYGLEITKQKQIVSAEVVEGQVIKRVDLPYAYYEKLHNIFIQATDAGNKALDAQQKALMVKKQYKKRICNDQIKVSFIDNNDYKAICNEDKYYTEIKQKLDAELVKINEQKVQKRVQVGQERQIRAQEMQAAAAQKQAQAAERQAQAAESDNLSNTINSMNMNNQLQQLNNNLFYMRMGW